MAVDTRDKRMSMMGLALPFRPLPNPAGGFGSDDRLQLLYLYSGIAAGEPEPSTQGSQMTLLRRRRSG